MLRLAALHGFVLVFEPQQLTLHCQVYGFNFLDKTTISYASIMGLRKDIGLEGDDYQCG